MITNEFMKCSFNVMEIIYTQFFNLVLTKCILPEEWVIGLIRPIYKNRGSRKDPDNYRGITLLSCMGKLFTLMLNERLKCFININGLLHEEKTGFRDDYSTIDRIFSLSLIVNIYLSKGKRLYAAFIDYKKAFDSINRVAIWKKLVGNGIHGLILKVIFNMYDKAKSCVSCGNQQSEYFQSNVGVRQGENLSPLLFALFLNDLVPFLSTIY